MKNDPVVDESFTKKPLATGKPIVARVNILSENSINSDEELH